MKSTIYTQNRELSWLRFNERVLDEAREEGVPAFERLKFISIFTSNLDEFFMIRVGSLYDQTLLPKPKNDSKTGMTPAEQLDAIFSAVAPLYRKKDRIYAEVTQRLSDRGITYIHPSEATENENKFMEKYFRSYVQPILSPQIINGHHPFPLHSDDSESRRQTDLRDNTGATESGQDRLHAGRYSQIHAGGRYHMRVC